MRFSFTTIARPTQISASREQTISSFARLAGTTSYSLILTLGLLRDGLKGLWRRLNLTRASALSSQRRLDQTDYSTARAIAIHSSGEYTCPATGEPKKWIAANMTV